MRLLVGLVLKRMVLSLPQPSERLCARLGCDQQRRRDYLSGSSAPSRPSDLGCTILRFRVGRLGSGREQWQGGGDG